MLQNKKIIVAGFVLFAVFAYANIFHKETRAQEEPLVTPDPPPAGQNEGNQKGREILALLADLKKIQLDGSIFDDPKFQELQDFSRELIPEPKGRPNPFAPIGKDVVLSEDFSGFATTSPRNIPFNTEEDIDTKTGKSSKKDGSVIVVPVGR